MMVSKTIDASANLEALANKNCKGASNGPPVLVELPM